MTKRIIELDIPLVEISSASSHEKSVRHGHPSTLHLWWARRPLAASRASIFAALADYPLELNRRKELLKLIKEITPWEAIKIPGNPSIAKAQEIIKQKWTKPPKVIDPFSGGGSIPLEALRIGCETFASDLNPLAVLIGKATLEWPQTIANLELATLVEKWAIHIRNEVNSKIGRFYQKDSNGAIPIGYLWARLIPCPNPTCKMEIPLIKHFWLSRTKKRKIAYKPVIDPITSTISYQIQKDNEIDFNPSIGTISRARAKCLKCNQVVNAKMIRFIAQKGKMTQKMTVVIIRYPNKPKKMYRTASSRDTEIFTEGQKYLTNLLAKSDNFDSILPDEDLPPIGTLGFGVQHYGITKWKDLFNDRQKLANITFMEQIKTCYPLIKKDLENVTELSQSNINLSNVIMAYLTIILGRLIDKNANLVVYNVYGEKIEHVFGRTALPMAWDYVELNVFSGANGDWLKQTEWVVRFLRCHSWKSISTASVFQASATDLSYPNEFFDAIFTDPPYYDNVPYSDLSDFFYVWFKRILGDIFTDLFATPLTPKRKEIVANKGRHKNPEAFFEHNLSMAFKEMNRILKQNGIAIIVYAHKSTRGWAAMLKALVQAGFVITASWPIHTEMKTRLRARTSAALTSSIYLVCRKKPQEEKGFFSEIRDELNANIYHRLQRFWKDGIRGGDFFISAIGPAMEILSKYKQIIRLTGENISFQDQLDYIRSISTNYLVNLLLNEENSFTIDNISQFYLAFRWTFQESIVHYGEVQKLSQACGIEIETMEKNGLIDKKGSKIKLLNALERIKFDKKDSSFVNIMHKALILWKKGKRDALQEMIISDDRISGKTFWHFCQAISECLTQKNPEKQLLEGLLSSKYSN